MEARRTCPALGRLSLAACDKNLGPESLVFVATAGPRNAGANESVAAAAGQANAFLGAAQLTFYEEPTSAVPRKDTLSGFLFDACYPRSTRATPALLTLTPGLKPRSWERSPWSASATTVGHPTRR